MPKDVEKILQKAIQGSELTFKELCTLAEAHGFTLRRIKGSHHIHSHPEIEMPLNLQPDKSDKSKAKRYQVRQLLAHLKTLGHLDEE